MEMVSSLRLQQVRLKINYQLVFFVICLLPFSVSLSNNDGASANYLFVLLPIYKAIRRMSVIKPGNIILGSVFIYLLIFSITTLHQIENIELFYRRTASFLIFMTIFSLPFTRITEEDLQDFKLALIISSIVLSLISLYKFIALGGNTLGSLAKGAVGSQRYGFVYLIAFWMIIFDWKKGFSKNIAVIILLIGLILTFSRSSIVSLFVSATLYFFLSFIRNMIRPTFRSIINFVKYTLASIIVIGIFFLLFPSIFEFFDNRLISLITDNNINLDKNSSEGYRIFMLKKVISFLSENLLFGSGFLGVWIMFLDQSGSAHNQYLDVLFRTGIIGFICYSAIIIKLLNKLRFEDRGLYWGVIGTLIYGMVHETFKLSYGAFILSFLIAYFLNINRIVK